MNYLAHFYLSKDNKDILIGNFISDAVKGKQYLQYPPVIQKGILLHREIDTFTDTHPIVKKSKRRLNKQYKHYAGVIIDVFYDHFLAKNWSQYSTIPLPVYAAGVYSFLEANIDLYPEKMKFLLPNMIAYNWLESYVFTNGIAQVLKGMNDRTKGLSKMNLAIEDLNLHYQNFEEDFTSFFPELIKFTNDKTNLLLNQ